MMRTPVFAANWKMYKTIQEATTFVIEFPRTSARPMAQAAG